MKNGDQHITYVYSIFYRDSDIRLLKNIKRIRQLIGYSKRDSTTFWIAISCTSCRISIGKHLHRDNCGIQRTLPILNFYMNEPTNKRKRN